MKDVLSDGKVPKLRWEYAAKSDLLPIPYIGSPYLFLGKHKFYCHQGKDFNLNKKEKYFPEKINQMKLDHIWKKSRKNMQPTKKQDCPVKFAIKKIFRFTKYNLLNDAKSNRENMSKAVKGDILKFSESGRLIDDLGTLQYLVIFPNEERHKFHYTGESISIIQPIDERVADYIRLQLQERCKTPEDIQCRVAYFVKENIFGGLRVKEAQRNKIIPSRKKIRNLILSVRNETGYSKIDQDNIEHLKEQWMKNGPVFF